MHARENTHTHAHMHARTRTHAHTHAHANTHTHTLTHAHAYNGQQMKAHVAAADEKRALHTELQSLREYCTSLWMKGEHASAAAGVSE
jgi:hypothetical protein